MNKQALEKANKAKRIAQAILEHLENWADDISGDQGLKVNTYCEDDEAWHDLFDLDAVSSEDLNQLAEDMTKIIEREL